MRQAIEAWIAGAQSDLALTLSWIRDLPSLGSDARHLQRESLEAFVVLIQNLSDTPELRAAGVAPPSRQLTIMLLGGLRELIATTVEDGGDIGGHHRGRGPGDAGDARPAQSFRSGPVTGRGPSGWPRFACTVRITAVPMMAAPDDPGHAQPLSEQDGREDGAGQRLEQGQQGGRARGGGPQAAEVQRVGHGGRAGAQGDQQADGRRAGRKLMPPASRGQRHQDQAADGEAEPVTVRSSSPGTGRSRSG